MKPFLPESIRNVGLFSHSGAGKTSLCEAFLFTTGATKRFLSVDEENSTFDTDEEEKSRRTSVSLHLGYALWGKQKINLVDTPGDLNFQADVRYGATAVDSALILVSAPDGVEVGTEKVYAATGDAGLPRMVLVNKMDRENANFARVLGEIKAGLAARPTVLLLPIGAAESFKGVIDIARKRAFLYEEARSARFVEGDVPAELAEEVEDLYNTLVENVAESDEELLEKYFEGELTDEDLQQGLRRAVSEGVILPVLACSARTLAGVPQVLDYLCDLVPSPLDARPRKAEDGTEIVADPAGDFVGFVFKTFVDSFAGKLTCVRVLRGTMPGSGELYNASTDSRERYSSLMVLQGKGQESIAQGNTGEIVVLAKLKETSTAHTLTDPKVPLRIPAPALPQRAIAFAVTPRSQTDEEKLGPSLHRLMEEDFCIGFERDEVTGEFLLSGLGQVHVESVVARLKSRFNVEVDLKAPLVPYKETIRKSGQARGRHKKQSGGRGQFGDCWVSFEPLPRGSGYEFVDKIVGGAIPRQFIPAVDKGITAALQHGVLAGFPMVDIRATCFDGSFHAVDSSDMAFQIAGSLAYKEAIPQCSPVILEPIMQLEVTVPEDCMGDVIGDLNARRGRVQGMEGRGKNQVIKAQVPMAEVLTYSNELKSLTSARGTFTMEFSHYEETPPMIQEKVIAEAKARKAEGE